MDIDIILEPDVTPQQMAELGIAAEQTGNSCFVVLQLPHAL